MELRNIPIVLSPDAQSAAKNVLMRIASAELAELAARVEALTARVEELERRPAATPAVRRKSLLTDEQKAEVLRWVVLPHDKRPPLAVLRWTLQQMDGGDVIPSLKLRAWLYYHTDYKGDPNLSAKAGWEKAVKARKAKA